MTPCSHHPDQNLADEILLGEERNIQGREGRLDVSTVRSFIVIGGANREGMGASSSGGKQGKQWAAGQTRQGQEGKRVSDYLVDS